MFVTVLTLGIILQYTTCVRSHAEVKTRKERSCPGSQWPPRLLCPRAALATLLLPSLRQFITYLVAH